MDFEHRSDCWYKDVCQVDSCDSCLRFLEMQHLLFSSGVPTSKQFPKKLIPADCDYNQFVQLNKIKEDIVSYVKQGYRNLYICSDNTGNGKTSWAIKILLKYFDSIWAGNGFRNRGLFIHVPTLLLQLKDFQNPVADDYKREILNSDIVIFDDIAVTEVSNYDLGNLLMYIDARILQEKFIIFTSNRTSRYSLARIVGERLASRIWETSIIVTLTGKDRRNGQPSDNK